MKNRPQSCCRKAVRISVCGVMLCAVWLYGACRDRQNRSSKKKDTKNGQKTHSADARDAGETPGRKPPASLRAQHSARIDRINDDLKKIIQTLDKSNHQAKPVTEINAVVSVSPAARQLISLVTDFADTWSSHSEYYMKVARFLDFVHRVLHTSKKFVSSTALHKAVRYYNEMAASLNAIRMTPQLDDHHQPRPDRRPLDPNSYAHKLTVAADALQDTIAAFYHQSGGRAGVPIKPDRKHRLRFRLRVSRLAHQCDRGKTAMQTFHCKQTSTNAQRCAVLKQHATRFRKTVQAFVKTARTLAAHVVRPLLTGKPCPEKQITETSQKLRLAYRAVTRSRATLVSGKKR